jgi:hypothetical protein
VVSVSDGRPWLLVAPWYRWADPADPGSGRYSRPAFQKYETADLVNEFLKNPRHCLRFLDEDFVHDVVTLPDPTPRTYLGRRRRLSDLGLAKTSVRKIFLATHKRFYLVVCELRCDAPGLPSASRGEVCEAGFVVRRRVVAAPGPVLAEGGKILGDYARTRQQLTRLEQATGGVKVMRRLGGASAAVVGATGEAVRAVGAAARHRVLFETRLEEHRQQLQDWALAHKVRITLEGWMPAGFQDVGAWQDVEEAPAAVAEHVYPLYSLVPDPGLPGHAGRDRTIYFGLLPTGSSETDTTGGARFDDQSLYEVRCYVRRHDPRCPRRPERRPDCQGEIVWSLPTEAYRLASQFDLVGTSNRPVTIQLPDLKALEAQAATLPRGRGAPVQMVAPEGSSLEVRVPSMTTMRPVKGSPGGGAICSFSIPLITIVATFVLNLFLPIVVFVFSLYWMLLLKFCIPPSVAIDAGVLASLNGEFGLGLNVGASVDVNAIEAANLAFDAKIDARVQAGAEIKSDAQIHGLLAGKIAANMGPEARATLAAEYAGEALVTANASVTAPPQLPDLRASLQFEDEAEVGQ